MRIPFNNSAEMSALLLIQSLVSKFAWYRKLTQFTNFRLRKEIVRKYKKIVQMLCCRDLYRHKYIFYLSKCSSSCPVVLVCVAWRPHMFAEVSILFVVVSVTIKMSRWAEVSSSKRKKRVFFALAASLAGNICLWYGRFSFSTSAESHHLCLHF